MKSTRAGDVLAGRYHLTVLLGEERDGHFWRANDSILGRPVAIHVVPADDERAPRLMEAARAAASVGDTHLLRILDAEITDDIAFVVNEWGSGTSLDRMLNGSGPLSPRRAAWIAGEVAETLAIAHQRGHAHGRLIPENVLIDDLGAVRLIGFAVEAALHGKEPGRVRTDLVDLTALLYVALTGKWAGETASALPPAPVTHGRVLRPRQVRAGVPRVLDDLCDRVLGRREEPPSARELQAALTAYVGDASDLGGGPQVGPPLAGAAAAAAAASADDEATQAVEPVEDDADTAPEPGQPVSAGPTDLTEPTEPPATEAMAAPSPDDPAATEPGLPTFDVDDDPDWTAPREDPAPPPPPLDPPPPKPLFADEPWRPRPQEEQHAPDPGIHEPEQEYWPWSGSGPSVGVAEEPESEPVPGRNWLRLAIGIAVAAVLVVCVALAYNLSRGHNLLGGTDEPTSSPTSGASPTPTTPPAPIRGVTADDFDPYGDPPAEYPDLTHYAVDGDPATTWRTSTYNDQFGPSAPALKPGVGLILDLQAAYAVDSVHLQLVGSPTTASVYVSNQPPTDAPSGNPAGHGELGTSGDVRLAGHPQGRYVLLWFTSLPHASDGYRLEVAEAKVTGSKVH